MMNGVHLGRRVKRAAFPGQTTLVGERICTEGSLFSTLTGH
jgi:hypothetical protein